MNTDPVSAKRVLVVDDNVDAATSLAMFVRILGHQVWVAHDGESGLKEALRLRPDVLFLDLRMPPGITGFDVAKRLREVEDMSATRIVAVSAFGDPESVRQAAQVGIDDYVIKPPDPKLILGEVGERG
jgi:two-component system CheB/CheR fusion protein